MKTKLLLISMMFFLAFSFSSDAIAQTSHKKPKLVVQITIDQMRGDFPMRYKDRLGEGGFRRCDSAIRTPLHLSE